MLNTCVYFNILQDFDSESLDICTNFSKTSSLGKLNSHAAGELHSSMPAATVYFL